MKEPVRVRSMGLGRGVCVQGGGWSGNSIQIVKLRVVVKKCFLTCISCSVCTQCCGVCLQGWVLVVYCSRHDVKCRKLYLGRDACVAYPDVSSVNMMQFSVPYM